MWIYKQSTGEISNSDSPSVTYKGYSGRQGVYQNNPAYQEIPNLGPIPQGKWGILGPPVNTSTHGPYVLHLYAKQGTNAFGRSGFLIHGDSLEHPGQASEGCIILSRLARHIIWESNDRNLEVVA
jgi:hypothetical protein